MTSIKIYWFMAIGFFLSLYVVEPVLAGQDISLYQSFAGNINFTGTGGSLRTSDIDACDITTSSSATISDIPSGATITAAYLYWAGSYSTQSGSTRTTPDYDITFESQNISAEREFTDVYAYVSDLDFFSGFADVTAIVAAKGNGTYTFSDLSVNDATPHCDYAAVLAGWALVVIYEDAGEDLRVINHFDGFRYYRGSEIVLVPNNFIIPASPINGKHGHISWEGDEGNSADFNGFSEDLTINGNSLIDALNPPNNQFNSTINILGSSTSYGVDFDVYDIDPYLSQGETSATTTYSSGADLVLLSAETVSVTTTPVADLSIDKTHAGSFEVGGQGTYTITVSSNGPSDIPGTDTIIIQDTLPSGLAYASSSGTGWTVDTSGDPVITWSHAGPLVNGESLPDVVLNVTVSSPAFPQVTNTAALSPSMSLSAYDNVTENNQDNDITVVGADLTTSIISVEDLNEGDAEPGDDLRYTITLIESGGISASNVSVQDHIPANVESFIVVSIPSGATDNSSPSPAGNNSTGLLDIQNIAIPANGSVNIIFKVTIAAGTAQGTTIDNSAEITNPSGMGGTVQSPTVTVSDSSSAGGATKLLYLYSSPDLNLSRTPPTPTQANVSINGNGASRTWTLTPDCQAGMTVSSGTASVFLWLSRDSVVYQRTINVELETSTGQSMGNRTRTLTLGTTPQLYLFNIPIASDILLNANDTINMIITNNSGRRERIIYITPIGSTSNSRVELQVTPVINVDSVLFYDGAYSGGNEITSLLLGNTFYARAVISDPFGTNDITNAVIDITDADDNTVVTGASMTMVNDSGSAEKTFEYSQYIGAAVPTGIWTVTVTGIEGTEGTVTDQGTATIQIVNTSVVEFTDSVGDPVDGYDMTGGSGTACIQVEDSGMNLNPSSAETVTVTISDATTGDDETLVLTETGVNTGIFFECLPLSTISGLDDDGTLNVTGGYDISASYTDSVSNTVTDTVYIPTRAVLSAFDVYEEDGQVIVEWETVSEVGTLGFLLYRKAPGDRKYIKLTPKLLPGLLVSGQGGIYRFVDQTAQNHQRYIYKLVEMETKGRKRIHGPFDAIVGGTVTTVGKERNNLVSKKIFSQERRKASSLPGDGKFMRKVREVSDRKMMRKIAATNFKNTAMHFIRQKAGDVAEIRVTDFGFFSLDFLTIADTLDIPSSRVKQLIRQNGISLSNMGNAVPYASLPDGQGIFFLGQPVDSVYTTENVYILEIGKGQPMIRKNTESYDDEREIDTFIEHLHIEKDNWALVDQFDDPESDYWIWDYIFSGYPGMDTKSFPFSLQDLADVSAEARLTLSLFAANDTPFNPDHHVIIDLNNTRIGEGLWNGTTQIKLDCLFDQSLLEEDNLLKITGLLDTGIDLSVVYVDAVDLQYERSCKAVENRLVFRTAEQDRNILVRGFTSPNIIVADITDPENPILIKNPTIIKEDNGYRITFKPIARESVCLAVAKEALLTADSITGKTKSRLKKSTNSADYIVITPLALMDASRRLAEYREEQGLETMVVDLSDIMDAFNYGVYHPEAVKAFLSYAYHNYQKKPEFVVLIGDGTYDYKNRKGFEDNLMPPVMVNTPDGLFASDNHVADILFSDGVPDIAIGRLPVATPEELYTVIEKIKTYESSGNRSWAEKILLVSDDPDKGGNFPEDSDDIADLVPAPFGKVSISLLDYSLENARILLFDEINQGALLLNFMGHGGLDRFTDEGLFVTEDVSLLDNKEKLPVILAMTCVTGYFAMPGYDSLSEALVLKENGGAVAVWAPTGLSINAQAKRLDEAFFKAVFEKQERILGKAVMAALEEFSETHNSSYMLDIYTLLGDPALRMW